ncbi:MAG: MFS transporter [Alphaproteobacteria bacterium]|nr:MFS transporter [Alphaproteobacteria bacterium]
MPINPGHVAGSPISYGVRVGTFFGALFLIYGVHLPFLPLWLEWRGLSAAEISLVVAVPYFLRVAVSPTIAFVADKSGRHRAFIIGLSIVAVAMAALLSQLDGFYAMLAAAVGLSLAMTTIMPLAEVIAVSGVRLNGCDYGRMRLWGSLTFIAASSAAAWFVGQLGIGIVIWLVLAGCVATAAAGMLLPPGERPGGTQLPADARTGGVDEAIIAPERSLDFAAVAGLIRSPAFILVLIACGTVQAAHATYYAFGSIHWSRQGVPTEIIGVLWAVGVFAEVGLFAWSREIFRKVSAVQLMIAGAVASVVRWGAMAFDPGIEALFLLQTLHALTFGASHLAAIRFISESVDVRLAGTAQALYATIAMGVAMGAATLLSGSFYPALGGSTYLLMAGAAAIGLAAGLAVQRIGVRAMAGTS